MEGEGAVFGVQRSPSHLQQTITPGIDESLVCNNAIDARRGIQARALTNGVNRTQLQCDA